MKRQFIGIFLLLFLSLSVMARDIAVTIYMDDDYKPYSYNENGQVKGIYADILRGAFVKMPGFAVTLEAVPWNRAKRLMASGDGFAISSVYFHGHDWPYLYPYSLPIYRETVIVVCNEKALKNSRPRWPQDYQGLLVGNVAGFDGWGGDVFRAMVKQKKIDYIEQENHTTLINMLSKGRVDCMLSEQRVFDFELKRLSALAQDKRRLKLSIGASVGGDYIFVGYSAKSVNSLKYPYAAKFRKAFDVAIYKMDRSGELNTIVNESVAQLY